MTQVQMTAQAAKATTTKRDSNKTTVIFRSIAAIFGGYLVAASLCGFLAVALPLPLVDATLIATMLSFGFYAAAAIRAFSAATTFHAWIELLGISLVMFICTQLMS